MDRNVVCTIARHIVGRGKIEVIVGGAGNRADDEVLEIAINDCITRETPGSGRCCRVKGQRLPIGSCVRVDIQEQTCAICIVQLDRAANCEVSR